MIENVLREIGGVGIYGILSVCLFFALFAVVLIWSARLKPRYLKSMRELPLESGERSPEPGAGCLRHPQSSSSHHDE